MQQTIPNDWEVVGLGDPKVTKAIFYGITAKASNQNSGIKMLRTTDINDYKFYYEKLPFCEITDSRNQLNQYKLFKGDIIIARAGTVGVSVLVDKNYEDTVFGSYLIKVRLKSGIHPKFVHYFFQSPIYWIHIQKAQGSTLKNINLPLLKSLILPLPPLSEQQKIAEILSNADQAIEEVNEAIAKTERLKKGLLQELLTKGIGHKEFKNTEIGKIPEDWHMTKLGNIIKQKKETISPCSIKPTRYIGLEHINSGECKIKQWGNSSEVKSIKFQFKAGDILYGKLRPYLNKVVIAEWNGVCSTDILVFEAKKIMINIYILYLMHHPNTLRYAIATSTGTNHPRTSWRMLSKLKVSLPPLPEQNKIAEILSTVDERIQLLKEKKNKLERVKKELMNDLLTGRKRVKVET